MIKGACYVRVSTENQLENYSIKQQTERLQAYCKAKDITITKIYNDGGYSGGNLNRPALQQMITDIKNHSIDAIIVYKLDRLSRSQKDTLTLIEDTFLSNHVDFISINENFDTSTPFGRAMIGILSVFSQLEKDQITERFTMGRIGRAKNGYFHGGGYAPTGYEYINGELVIHEYEALQVRELFERFAKGYSLHSCWQYMQQNYTTKYGAWKSETLVRNILKNQLYIGNITFKGSTYPGNHTPIISTDLFTTVQNRFLTSKKPLPFKSTTLLSGLLYCEKCGAKFHAEHGNYSCYSRTKGDKKYIMDPNCKNKKWNIQVLDQRIINCITSFSFSELNSSPLARGTTNDYTKRILEIEKQIEKLIGLYQIEGMPLEIISKKISHLNKEKHTLENQSMKPDTCLLSNHHATTKNTLLYLFSYGELQEKRTCLSTLIKKISLDDDIITIKLHAL